MKTSHLILTAVIILGAALFLTQWNSQLALDRAVIQFTPDTDKALKASDYAIKRVQQSAQRTEDQALDGIYAVQDLLTITEQHLSISGNPHKALRTQQQIEENLRTLKEELAKEQQRANTEEYQLVLEHAALRTDLLLKEVEFAKQKSKARAE